MALEALGVASSVIAVVEISGRIAAICFQYSKGVKNAKEEVNRLLREVNSLGETTSGVQDLLQGPNGNKLKTSKKLLRAVEEAQAHLRKLDGDLRPSSTQKAFRRLGIGALKWPLKSNDVERVIQQLGRCAQTISLALQVDQTSILVDVDQKAVLSRLPAAVGAMFDSFDEGSNPTCMENTRVSLLDLITQWVDDPSAETIFWLNGMAGTGKSTIARTVARMLDRAGYLGASFFFKRGEADRDTLRKFFATIAAQLVTKVPGTATHIKEAIDADPTIFQKAMPEQFDKLIVQPLSKVDHASRKTPTLVILIDALDECGESPDDIRRVINLLSRTNNFKTPRVQYFVTSRPELPIRIGFGLVKILYRNVALQEIPEYVIQHDISVFLEHQLANIRTQYNATVPEDRRLPLTWPGNETVQTLMRMANPLFIFAATVCRYLADLRWHPDDQLAKVLRYQTKSQQSKLDATYRPVLDPLIEGLDKVEKVELLQLFRAIVGSIVVLARPLSVPSLAKVLNLSKRTIEQHLDGLHSVLSVPKSSAAPVRLFHLSFRDFLLDPTKEDENPFWVSEIETHNTMAANCFRVMNETLREDICNLKDPGIARTAIDPERVNECISDEVQYACANWVLHLQLSESTVCDSDTAHTFLKTHFLHWIEALSLMGRMRDAITMIKSLKKLLADETSDEISAFLEDAYRVILTFMSTISSHPLQLYSSVLLFAPQKSIIRNVFQSSIPSWICSLPNMRPDWDDCLQILEGHHNSVTAVTFSPSGTRLVSASRDETVRLWDTNTGDCLQVLQTSAVASTVVFSSNENYLLAACEDGIVRMWDTDTEECVLNIRCNSKSVSCAEFSGGSGIVVASYDDKSIRIWDRITGEATQELIGHSGGVHWVCVSYDSTLMASASCDRTIRIWRLESGSSEFELMGHRHDVTCCKFSHDASLLVSSSDDEDVRIWSVETGNCLRVLREHEDRLMNVAFSHDASLVASTGFSGYVAVHLTTTGELVQRMYGHTAWNFGVDFSPDSSMVASASRDGTVRIWRSDASKVNPEDYRDIVIGMYASYERKQLAAVSYADDVTIWSAKAGRCIKTLPNHDALWRRAAYSPDSSVLATSSKNQAWIWDAETAARIAQLDTAFKYGSEVLEFSQDSRYLVMADKSNGIQIWEVDTRKCVWEDIFRAQKPPVSMTAMTAPAMSADSKLLATGFDRKLKIWNLLSKTLIREYVDGEGSCDSFAFSPDGSLIALALVDEIQLQNVLTGECIRRFEGRGDKLVFSADSSLVASAKYGRVQIWNAQTGMCLKYVYTGGSYSGLFLCSDGGYLRTDVGIIPFGDLDETAPQPPPIEKAIQVGCGISSDGKWVTWNGRKVVWLPTEFRHGSSVVLGSTAAVGSTKCVNIAFIELDQRKIPV